MPLRTQPGNQLHQVLFRHCRAARGRPIHATPNMKENRAAGFRDRRIGIVPDLDEPVIGEIARTHFFMRVIVGRVPGINHDMAIVIR